MLSFNDIFGRVLYGFVFIIELNNCQKTVEKGSINFKLWGPGLDPTRAVLPVQYFFIQASDSNGNL